MNQIEVDNVELSLDMWLGRVIVWWDFVYECKEQCGKGEGGCCSFICVLNKNTYVW